MPVECKIITLVSCIDTMLHPAMLSINHLHVTLQRCKWQFWLQVYCLEIEPYMLELAQPKFEAAGVADRIEVLVGSATDSIEKLLKQGVQFDIAFLDADKTGYLGYYKQLMDNQLINPGGIVVVDNALMKVDYTTLVP